MLRGATSTGPEPWAGEAGAGICLPGRRGRQGPTAGWQPDPRRRRQLGAGKGPGLEFNVGLGGSK